MHIMHDDVTVFNWIYNLIILRISQKRDESNHLHIRLFGTFPIAGFFKVEEKYPNQR